jgi:hypothetical protein
MISILLFNFDSEKLFNFEDTYRLTLYVHACHPRGTLPAPGLAGYPVGRGE